MEGFYDDYDKIIRLVCPEYDHCLNLIAMNIPATARKILDLGSGTGNLALKILKQRPEITVFGIEAQASLTEIAARKMPSSNARFFVGDMIHVQWPPADCVVSSLALHHLTHEGKAEILRRIHHLGAGFLYFDRVKGSTVKEDSANVAYILGNMRRNGFPEQRIHEAKKDLEKVDNPMTSEELISLFDSVGFACKALFLKNGVGVYSCTRNE